MDLGFVGPKYTWCNCQEGSTIIKERFDRGVANLAYRNLFLEAEVVVHVATWSDHAPLTISLKRPKVRTKRQSRFFFEAGWALDMGYNEMIKLVWRQKESRCSSWDQLESKLKDNPLGVAEDLT